MTDEEKAAAAKAAADKAAADAAAEVKFNEAQKARVNEIVTERMSQVAATHAAELVKMQKDFEAKLLAKKEPVKEDDDPLKKQYETLLRDSKTSTEAAEALAGKRQKSIEALETELRSNKKDQSMRSACNGMNFVDVDAVIQLTGKNIEFDEASKQFVVRENGIIKQDDTLKPMKLKDFFAKWAEERPYMVGADAVGGTGSSESRGRDAGTGSVIKTKADFGKDTKAKSQWIAKHGFAKFELLPLK
jgi:hypothetical protein